MKVIFENKFNLTKNESDIPFLSGDMPVGVVSEINDDTFTVSIFDRYIGFEMIDGKVCSVYLSHHEQMSYDEFKIVHDKRYGEWDNAKLHE